MIVKKNDYISPFEDSYGFCGTILPYKPAKDIGETNPKTQEPPTSPSVNNMTKNNNNPTLQKPQNNDNNR